MQATIKRRASSSESNSNEKLAAAEGNEGRRCITHSAISEHAAKTG
jgi:hypothetical protein